MQFNYKPGIYKHCICIINHSFEKKLNFTADKKDNAPKGLHNTRGKMFTFKIL
jgi:hypothetical protein